MSFGDGGNNLPKYDFALETPASSLLSLTSDKEMFGSMRLRRRMVMERTTDTSSSRRQIRSIDGTSSSASVVPHSAQSRSRISTTPGTGMSSAKSRTSSIRTTPYAPTNATPVTTAVLVAVVEGRGLARGEIGMASIDLKNPVLTLSQFSDSQAYSRVMTKLQIIHPLEIIMPSTACEGGMMTKLYQVISDQYQNENVSTVQRKYFNETKGLQYIKQLCLSDYSTVEMEVRGKYYCLSATAALMKYVEFVQNMVYAPGSLKVVFKGSEKTTMIDAQTVKNLEMLQNLRNPNCDHTLYGILRHTKTAMGTRLLRASILQPPSDIATISLRQQVVTELIENEALFYNLQILVGRFLDTEHLLSMCVQIPKQENVKTAEAKINNIIYLKHVLELLDPLRDSLKETKCSLLREYSNVLSDPRFTVLVEKIGTVIHGDTRYQKGALNMRTQKCFAVKTNINGLLDVSRRTYTERVDDIDGLVQQLGKEHSLPLKTAYNSTRGFHIQLYCSGNEYTAESLPGVFVKVTKFKNILSFTTTDLIKFNDRVKESLKEIYFMTNVVVTALFKEIYPLLGCLYKLTECVSMLDMLVGFAHNCTLSDYVRPDFTDTLAIKQGRHPVLDKISVETPVPNNTYASEENNFIIITGPNMSGKSTYLRQIVLLQIMAQIGSFVPAEYASFRIADQIFSRIGSDDDMEMNCSTFTVEMKEVNYIIQNATKSSLVIIDELGRGTSTEEGVGLCHAICEHLLSQKMFTFFATHFMELTKLSSLYPGVENYHFEVQRVFSKEGDCDKVVFTHVLSKGITREKHYGIQLAEVSTLPSEIIKDAKEIADALTKKKVDNEMTHASREQCVVFRLVKRLSQAAQNSRLDEHCLGAYLQTLKDQYHRDLTNNTNDMDCQED